jgi:hypothetical protein
MDEFKAIGYTLIPIFWTSLYMKNIDIQKYIDTLPPYKKYFAVSQHDDAIRETLPKRTVVFSAGGNSGGIPIPLICSGIPSHYIHDTHKDIFCSFVGSLTHYTRYILYAAFQNDNDFYIKAGKWSLAINDYDWKLFLDITARSKFTLCPRGYGAQSFRLYEAIQLSSVPVYIHDDNKWLPFSDIINYDEFCVCIHIKDLRNIKTILKNISEEKHSNMLRVGKEVYNNFFTLEKTSINILNKLKQI